MSRSKFTVPRGVVCESVGDELMVVVPGRTEVVTLTGETAEVFLDVQAGRTPHAAAQLTSELEALGLIEASGMSRRGLIKAGAIGAGAGIAVMAMPGVAAAASSLLILQMGEYGGNAGVAPNTRKSIIFGAWGLEEFIPDGSVGVFKLLDQEFEVTDGADTPFGPFSGYPFFFNVVKIDGIRDFVVFTRDIPESELAGQTATVTFAALNIRVEYTFAAVA